MSIRDSGCVTPSNAEISIEFNPLFASMLPKKSSPKVNNPLKFLKVEAGTYVKLFTPSFTDDSLDSTPSNALGPIKSSFGKLA